MKLTFQARAFLASVVLTMMTPIVSLAQSTITCARGNPNLQDIPKVERENEATCNGDQGCIIRLIQRNNEVDATNNRNAQKNLQLANQRAQCDNLFAAQDKTAADEAAAKAKENAEASKKASEDQAKTMQDAAKSLAGGNNNDKKEEKKEEKSEDSGSSGGGQASGLDEKGTDSKGEGNKEAKQGAQGAVQQMASLKINNGPQLQAALQKLIKDREACINGQDTAANMCLESLSPSLTDAAPGVNAGLSALSTASAYGSIDKGALPAMTAAQAGYTGFIATCSAANATCKSSCATAKESLKALKNLGNSATCTDLKDTACSNSLQSAKTNLQQSLAKEEKTSDKTTIAGKEKTCKEKYDKTLLSALDGLAKLLAALMQAKQNAADTAAAAGAAPTITGTTDCTDPSQSQTITCLCLANPRLSGCNNGLADAAGNGSGGLSSDPGLLSSTATDGTTFPTGGGMELPPLNKDGSGGGAPLGGAAGGSAGLGGSGGGFGGGDAKAAGNENANKPLDANILAGTSGGGGGGGGWGGFGGGNEKYKDYLPGGKRDPANKAGANAFAAEVSGPGGKSNWEKVKDRYRDAKPTLLNTN